MGLLDDAIREHLDLKRRRGADPAEIERAEREALGPVRRGPEAAELTEPQARSELPYDDQLPYDEEQGGPYADEALPYDEEGGDWDEPFDEAPEAAQYHEPADVEFDRPGPEATAPPVEDRRPIVDQPTQHMSIEDEPDEFDEPPAPRSAATPTPHAAPAPSPGEHEPPRRRPTEATGGETVEYDVEGQGEDDDVLEETPEFLQDTPDHDRLWFEQKPPRDFDFDG